MKTVFYFVRAEGLEPPCLAAPDPKSGMSTNFTTPGFFFPQPLHSSLTKRAAKIGEMKFQKPHATKM